MDFKEKMELDALYTAFRDECNKPPKTKKHPMTKKDYVPISEVEAALDVVLKYGWTKEVMDVQQNLNSFLVHLRLHFTHPVSGEKMFTDGLGACPIQGIESTVKANACQLALPAAEAYALKDAAETLGKIFGRDASRDHAANFTNEIKNYDNRDFVVRQAMQKWNASDKSQTTLDEFLKHARKQGVESLLADAINKEMK